MEIDLTNLSLDSTFVKVSPNAADALKKNGKQSFGRTQSGICTKRSVLVANPTTVVPFCIVPGNFGDPPKDAHCLIRSTRSPFENASFLMDCAYERTEMRTLAAAKGFNPVVFPTSNRTEPCEYDKELYKRRNEIERIFRCINGFRIIESVSKNGTLPL